MHRRWVCIGRGFKQVPAGGMPVYDAWWGLVKTVGWRGAVGKSGGVE